MVSNGRVGEILFARRCHSMNVRAASTSRRMVIRSLEIARPVAT